MKFLADVNIPQSLIKTLETNGHYVFDLKKVKLEAPDTEVIAIAQREQYIILTRDKDFIALTQFPKYQVATIAIRLLDQNPQHIVDRVLELLLNQDQEILMGSLTIITEESADSYAYEK